MKRAINVLFAVLLILIWSLIWPISPPSTIATAEDKVSAPGNYSGYSPVLYDGYKMFSQYVTMRDGCKLAVDIIRPTLNGQVVTTPLPVIWMHTPYNRRYYGTRLTAELYPGAAMGLVKYGYVVAAVDMRGYYASYGSTYSGDFWDAYDLTEWFAAQSWSTGKIGMWGCSVPGITQVAAVSLMPPHLKAIFPLSAGSDYIPYSNRGTSYPPDTPRLPPPTTTPGSIPAADANAAPVDDDPDKTMLRAAKEEHRYNYLFTGKVATLYPPSKDQIEQTGVAVYNACNWVDAVGVPLNTIRRYHNLSNPDKLLVAPGGHCIWCTEYSPKAAPLDFTIVPEELRWFDYWLKGIDNGIMDEPPIYYYTYNADTGKNWRFSWQWPLPNAQSVNFYLGEGPSGTGYGVNDGTLGTASPATAGAKDVYTTDYSITSVLVSDTTGTGGSRGVIVQPEAATKGLTYITAPLTADLELTGHPVVHLWISSTATDGDFMVDVEDVAEDGTAASIVYVDRYPISTVIPYGKPLTEGINAIRASLRAIMTPPFDNWGIPWHRNSTEDVSPLTPGEPVELIYDFRPVSYTVKAGHRIRLTITAVCDEATPRLSPAPVVTFYRNPQYSSYITLPVVAPVTVTVRIVPGETTLAAHMTFPETMDSRYLSDIRMSSVKCNGIAAASARMEGNTLIAVFSRSNLKEGQAMAITGEFGNKYNYGNITFAATGTVPSSSGSSNVCFINTAGFGSKVRKFFETCRRVITGFIH